MDKKYVKTHFLPEYLINPYHRIKILVIGSGGNGSKVLTSLARINQTLIGLERLPIQVTIMDPDKVEEFNVGRQLFSQNDIGQYKAEVLITRLNRFFGTEWLADTNTFTASTNINNYNIVISCVDNIEARRNIAYQFKKSIKSNNYNEHNKLFYWLDFGNGKDYGQVILGSRNIPQPKSKYKTLSKLKSFIDLYPKVKDEEEDGPSCSYQESLNKQSLFINSTLVELGMNMFYNLLLNYKTNYNSIFLNLDKVKVNTMML
jgi:PRTRC genetic system ThiF family protein